MWEQMGERQGRHPRHALTAQKVKALKPNGRPQRIADGGGLYLLMAAGGAKSWILRTIVRGKRCDIGLPNPQHPSPTSSQGIPSRHRAVSRTSQSRSPAEIDHQR